MEPSPTTGYYPVLDYVVPTDRMPLSLRKGIAELALKYSPAKLLPSAVIFDEMPEPGAHRLYIEPSSVSALQGFKPGETVNFETNDLEQAEAMRKDLESLIKTQNQ